MGGAEMQGHLFRATGIGLDCNIVVPGRMIASALPCDLYLALLAL